MKMRRAIWTWDKPTAKEALAELGLEGKLPECTGKDRRFNKKDGKKQQGRKMNIPPKNKIPQKMFPPPKKRRREKQNKSQNTWKAFCGLAAI